MVVIAFFDHEAGAWLERGIAGHPFDRRLPFPSGYRCSDCEATFPGVPDTSPAQLYLAGHTGALLVVTGVGTVSAGAFSLANNVSRPVLR